MIYLIPLTLLHLSPRSPPSNPTPHLINTRPLNLMIPRVRSSLIQNILRRASQLHPFSPEAQVADPTHVLVPIPKVVHEEQRRRHRRPKRYLLVVFQQEDWKLLPHRYRHLNRYGSQR